jgi:hypothetical protein
MFQRLGGTDLVAGETAHTVPCFYRDCGIVMELVHVHGAVFDAQTAPIARTCINVYIYHCYHLIAKYTHKNLQYQFIKTYRRPSRIKTTYER